MSGKMKRRQFITLLGGAAIAWPVESRAQQPDQVRRIGVLMGYAESDSDARAWYAAFRAELQTLGWTELRCSCATTARWSCAPRARTRWTASTTWTVSSRKPA